ncbi:MAG: substrate-binding domain-containing protein [Anaerolineae bacterium]|nr:substrate-binding domain-containing protein [Anaerolineae bacterium]
MQTESRKNRVTVGVLAGEQMYYRTILGTYVGPVLHGIISATNDYGCNLLLSCGMEHYMAKERPAWPKPGADVDFLPVGPWNCDGLIVLNALFSESRSQYIRDLAAQGTAVTYVNICEPGPSVGVDNESGIRQAMEHLIAHGHRAIAFLAGHPRDLEGDSRFRLDIYRRLVQEFNLVNDPDLIVYSYHCIDGGKKAMQQLLDSGVSFTAVLASNDEAAIGALAALHEANVRVPQDVAIIGFDDTLEASTQVPPLTTIHYSQSELGYRAVELLLEYIADPGREIRNVKIPVRLIRRQSCGCRPGAHLSADDLDIPKTVTSQNRPMAMSRLVQAMTESAMSEAQHLSVEEVHVLCSRLVEAFVSSAKFGEPTTFYQTLDEVLAQTDVAMEDAHIWHSAATVLESHLGLLLGTGRLSLMHGLAEVMLHHMWIMVTESAQRQFRRQMARKEWVGYCVGQLSIALLNAINEAQIYESMVESLPRMGIERVDVAFFEPEGDDPVAWSLVRSVLPPGESPRRMLSRQFPAPDLYAKPFQLALLPLHLEDRTGFVVFDVAKLEVYGGIVWQLVTFFKTVRLYQEATEGRRLAEEASRFKSRFLSMVSHELRTPLSLIIGLSEMILRDETDNEAVRRRDLETILTSARDLDTLLRDVLALSRADINQLQLTCEALDLTEVLHSVAAIGRQMAGDKGLTWQVDLPDRLPPVWGDRTRLRQVVMNLVSNAVKFTWQGSVTLRAGCDADAITVSVADTGPGVPPDERDTIFTEFHQGTRTSNRGYGGLGLGLAICRLLVEMHQGRIGVESSGAEGDGATFYFSIPRFYPAGVAQEESPQVLSASPLPAASPSVLQPAVVLGVSRAGGESPLQERLTRQGFDVRLLQVDAIRNWELPPQFSASQALVLDAHIAAMQGWEVLTALRSNSATRDTPVMFYSLEADKTTGSFLEVDYLRKPLSVADLTLALERQGVNQDGAAGKTILIVDDEPFILQMHARMVKLWSPEIQVLEAKSGQEALALMRETVPDLVLLDLMMPEVDGFDVLEAMREASSTRDVPVVVVTAQVLSQDDMARLNRGVASVLQKELFSVPEMLTHIAEALERRRVMPTPSQSLARKAMGYVHEHYDEESLSLESVAGRLGVCKEYLARSFREETGVTLVTYLNRYRVERAKALLRGNPMRIVDVALEVGFSSSAYFSRVFRQEVGQSPQEYRQVA